jgi:heme/copper-type cytochrome/quinol oxidase subunit 4
MTWRTEKINTNMSILRFELHLVFMHMTDEKKKGKKNIWKVVETFLSSVG